MKRRPRLETPWRGDDAGTGPPLLDLDDPLCLDPAVSGGKAAWLARGRQAGLGVLPGMVVAAPFSRHHLGIGRDALTRRGSGGARLEVSAAPLDAAVAEEVVRRAGELGDPLVVRSSSLAEAGPEWSGAFTSYLDIHPPETPRAVAGCWASVFAAATIDRHAAAGVEPGSVPMAVLVQPALDPAFGGTARLEGAEVVMTAVAGSPAPLVQGWEPGVQARLSSTGPPQGDSARDLMGDHLLAEVGSTLRRAAASVGATACEWAVTDQKVVILQLGRFPVANADASLVDAPELAGELSRRVAQLSRRYPGPLGEMLVLPWVLGDPAGFLAPAPARNVAPGEALARASEHAAALTAEVWSASKSAAAVTAAATLRALRGPDPAPALDRIASLHRPDPERGRLVLSLLATVREALATAGAVTWPETAWHLHPDEVRQRLAESGPSAKRDRIGFDRWEPFNAAVVAATGARSDGVSAAPGVASGRLCYLGGRKRPDHFRPRDVIVAPYPTPNLGALLWDAAALVTTGGGPAAHLFESARALAIPAVCGIHLDEALGRKVETAGGAFALAVLGDAGTVYATEW